MRVLTQAQAGLPVLLKGMPVVMRIAGAVSGVIRSGGDVLQTKSSTLAS
jgi:hypothetical protein